VVGQPEHHLRRRQRDAHGSWSITGLSSDTATFNGSGTFSFDATVRSVFRPGAMATYSFDASAAYHAIRIATQQRQVIDGSANFDLSAQAQVSGTNHDSSAAFDVHAQITFHADHTADLRARLASQHYSLNLTTGGVVRVGT